MLILRTGMGQVREMAEIQDKVKANFNELLQDAQEMDVPALAADFPLMARLAIDLGLPPDRLPQRGPARAREYVARAFLRGGPSGKQHSRRRVLPGPPRGGPPAYRTVRRIRRGTRRRVAVAAPPPERQRLPAVPASPKPLLLGDGRSCL